MPKFDISKSFAWTADPFLMEETRELQGVLVRRLDIAGIPASVDILNVVDDLEISVDHAYPGIDARYFQNKNYAEKDPAGKLVITLDKPMDVAVLLSLSYNAISQELSLQGKSLSYSNILCDADIAEISNERALRQQNARPGPTP